MHFELSCVHVGMEVTAWSPLMELIAWRGSLPLNIPVYLLLLPTQIIAFPSQRGYTRLGQVAAYKYSSVFLPAI